MIVFQTQMVNKNKIKSWLNEPNKSSVTHIVFSNYHKTNGFQIDVQTFKNVQETFEVCGFCPVQSTSEETAVLHHK